MLMLITSSLNLRNKRRGASPCVCKHYQLTKVSRKHPKYELKERRTIVLYDVCDHMDPCGHLPDDIGCARNILCVHTPSSILFLVRQSFK